jgi:hypothetical protein
MAIVRSAERGGAAEDRDALLEQRAARFVEEFLDSCRGPGGMVISFSWFDTRRPIQEGEKPPEYAAKILEEVWGKDSPRPTVAEWYYGENTLWATGFFLWSQLLRYRVTREDAARELARTAFRDLNHFFDLSATIEPGLLGKPHGGRAGPTTSFDQAAFPILPYVWFAQSLATPEEKAAATRNMAAHGDYYLRRNWTVNHHGTLHNISGAVHTSVMKYLACVYAAYELTGDTRFRDDALTRLRRIIGANLLPWPMQAYETNHNLFYYAFLCDYWSRSEAAGNFDWNCAIGEYWTAAKASLGGDGLVRWGSYDTVTRKFTPYPTGWLTDADAKRHPHCAPSKPGARRWVCPTSYGNRSLNCALVAALGSIVRSRGIDANADAVSRRILTAMDVDSLRWWWDDGSAPAELSDVTNLFAPEVAAAWLCAYWLSRQPRG